MLTVSSKYFIEGYAFLLVFFLVYVKKYRVLCVSVHIHLKIVQEKLLFFLVKYIRLVPSSFLKGTV